MGTLGMESGGAIMHWGRGGWGEMREEEGAGARREEGMGDGIGRK